jgi:hypothetical protein
MTAAPSRWSVSSTELLGSALLRLEVARELARARLLRTDAAMLERWQRHEREVERQLDLFEQRLAATGEDAVQVALSGIHRLELEVCEFIPAPSEPSPDARRAIAPVACREARH